MKKQLLLFILTLLPLVAIADAVEINGIYYNLISKIKEAEVTSNPDKYSGYINIPKSVTYNEVEYNVTSIGNKAFYDCSSLTSVTIPTSVTSIGIETFKYCSSLTSVTIPNSVTNIGISAFYNCSCLTSVIIPQSMTSINNGTFSGCSGLTSIIIPNSVTSIGSSAFYGCSGLNFVIIPNSVISIGHRAFWECSGLTAVYITDLEAWSKISFNTNYSNPLYYAHHLFLNGSEIKDLVIPNNVTSIGDYAFYGCSGLTSVTIPNSVTSIGSSAFLGCSGLTSVVIGNSVTSIGGSAFYGCSGLTSVTIPNSVTTIDDSVFGYCSGLTSITIGNGVTSIGWSVFAFCPEITDVTCLAESVPTTKNNVFENSYINSATLHVPSASLAAYSTAEPWSGFKYIVAIDGTEVQKCTTPTISVNGGELTFTCETEDVEYHASYSYNNGSGNGSGNKLILAGTTTAHVSVYATKEGYLNSDTATADVELNVGLKGDVNQDGVVSITDAVSVVNIILGE